MVQSSPSRLARAPGRVKLVVVLIVVPLALAGAHRGAVSWKLHHARAEMQRGDFAAALVTLESADRWPPRRAETAFLLARTFRRSGDLEQCEAWLKTASERGWSPQDVRAQRHLLELQCGRFEQSQAWLTQVLASGADDDLAEEIYEAQAKGFLRSYRLNEAVVCLRYWIEWKPNAIQPRLWLADVWERCDRWQAAADEFQAVVDRAPDHFEARKRLAENLLTLNHVDRAYEHFQFCAERAPDDDAVALGLARCQRRSGHPEEAEQTLARRLDASPDKTSSVEMLVELGQIAIDLRQVDRAIELLREAIGIDPAHALAHATLAEAFRKSGRIDEANEHHALADQINARYSRLSKVLGQLADTPGDADLRFKAGKLLMEQGLRAEGAAWMATALETDPTHGPAHEALADYFTAIGDHDRAAHHQQRSGP